MARTTGQHKTPLIRCARGAGMIENIRTFPDSHWEMLNGCRFWVQLIRVGEAFFFLLSPEAHLGKRMLRILRNIKFFFKKNKNKKAMKAVSLLSSFGVHEINPGCLHT